MDGVSLEAELNRVEARENPDAWTFGPKITTAQLLEAIKNKTDIPIIDSFPKAIQNKNIGFGKYAAKTYKWVEENDSSYFRWACEKVSGFKMRAQENGCKV